MARQTAVAGASLGLPATVTACLFDLDGVLTRTAEQHARAWKQVFEERGIPFDAHADYDAYVDGRPRVDGVRSFLAARHIDATPDLVEQIAARKDEIFTQVIERDGVRRYEGSVRYLQAARTAGLRLAVVTSSKHCTQVLHAAGLDGLFDAQVDGNLIDERHIPGKPAPDTYIEAGRMLGVEPGAAAVYEDALPRGGAVDRQRDERQDNPAAGRRRTLRRAVRQGALARPRARPADGRAGADRAVGVAGPHESARAQPAPRLACAPGAGRSRVRGRAGRRTGGRRAPVGARRQRATRHGGEARGP